MDSSSENSLDFEMYGDPFFGIINYELENDLDPMGHNISSEAEEEEDRPQNELIDLDMLMMSDPLFGSLTMAENCDLTFEVKFNCIYMY